jgi:hypothetical protein
MGVKFNPFTGNLDFVGDGEGGAATSPGGADTQIQYNDDGDFAGSADLTWDDTDKVLGVGGDINLDDSGDYTTTLQTVTPTADRTISFPDATGTIGLVAGSSGQAIYNDAGAYSGLSTVTTDGTNVTLTGRFIGSLNGAASAPPGTFTGTWFTGGTATTTKPQVLIEPTGTTSTAWSTSGTGLGVNAASGFAGNLLDLQVNGTSNARVTSAGNIFNLGSYQGGEGPSFSFTAATNGRLLLHTSYTFGWSAGGAATTNNADLLLARDTANTLAQRRGTNAQTSRIYNTFTSATNFERAKIEWASNILRIGTEKGADGGTARDMELQTDGTTRITLKADGAILFSGIPTSDPTVAGQLWNDGGTLKISAG